MAQEMRCCRMMSGEVFGFYALQLGYRRRILRVPVRSHAIVGVNRDCSIVADWTALPFAAESVDCIVLAHALEASGAPHEVLREAARVLRPHGRLLVIGFNPWSLLGARISAMPWRKNWISLMRVKDWLTLLNLSAEEGQFAAFMPPHRRRHRKWFGWMEKAGRRWWPLAGGVYILSATKYTCGMRMIRRLRHRRIPFWRAPSKAKAECRR